MDRIKKLKIKKQDGTFSDYIPIGADAENIDTTDGESVETKLNKKPYYYNTVADMKADTKLKIGDMAITLGYYAVNDGGGALYKIRNYEITDTIDEASIISINETLIAELIFEDSFVNISQFGIKEGNNSENATLNTQTINKAITFCENNNQIKNIKFPAGIFCVDSGILISDNIGLYGVENNSLPENVNHIAYKGGTIIKDCSERTNLNDLITYYKSNERIWGITIKNIYFVGVNRPYHKCLNLVSVGWDAIIENVVINQFLTAIYFNDCYDSFIKNLTVVDSDQVYNNVVNYAIEIDDTINPRDYTNALHFTNCHFEISKHCIRINKGRQNCFTNCKFEFGNVADDEYSQILITENAQDTQFIGCSFVGLSKANENQPYTIDIKSTNSLRNTMFVGCEFIRSNGSYKLLKTVGGTIINSCSFQLLTGEDFALYLNGRTIFTNNYLRCKDTSISGGTTEIIYANNSIISNNMFEYTGGGTNIVNSRAITFVGEQTKITNNSNTRIFSQPYYFDGNVNMLTKLDRDGVITLNESDLTNLYGTDFSVEGDIIIPLDLNDVKGAKVIRFNCSKQITLTDIKKAVGQDNIMISSSNQAVKIKGTSTTSGTRILIPGGIDQVVVFGNQLCDMHFVDWYWRTGYFSNNT